jgi:hypothetical protein
MRKWVSFGIKLLLSLMVVSALTSVALSFYYPSTIMRIWEDAFLAVIISLDVLGIIFVTWMIIDRLRETRLINRAIALPGKYVKWLMNDVWNDRNS